MMLRRRLMVLEEMKNDEWDYELYPANGLGEGEFAVKKINVSKGQILTLNYFATKSQGYLIDARPSTNKYYGLIGGDSYRIAVNEDDTCYLEVASDGVITIAGHRLTSDGELSPYSTDRFYGKYIKIKIN